MSTNEASGRLLSLDFFRGLTMFLLIAEFTHLFSHFYSEAFEGSLLYVLSKNFHHHPWAGLRFWDLVQPYFMFIVGVAMPLSFAKRQARGDSQTEIRTHVLKRALLLLLLGWGLYCMGPEKIVFRFQNVLAQLSVTYLIAYAVMKKSFPFQVVVSVLLIIATELLYRFFWIEGFDMPFEPNKNFGTWLDLQYGGADLGGHWVSFNAIPTAAHTIWGVLAGQLLMGGDSASDKLKKLITYGAICLVLGYALSFFIPIIKRICTSSFIFVSGGWTILSLALCYWLIDMRKWKGVVWPMAIVGMNPLFIYLLAHIGGADLLSKVVAPFINSLLGWLGANAAAGLISMATLFLLWYLCYWLYKKKIFIRI